MEQNKIFRTRNTFVKHLEVYFTRIKMGLKENNEYKGNLFSVILVDFLFFGTYVFFYYIYQSLFSFEFLDWSFYDFILFFVVCMLAAKFLRFSYLRLFKLTLIGGYLNLFRVKPINTYIFSTFVALNGPLVPSTLIFVIILIGIIYLGNYANYLLFILVFIFSILFYQVFVNFLTSFHFFMKEGEFITTIFNHNINFLNEKYTPIVFSESMFKNFFFILPAALYGYFSVEILRGEFKLFLYYLPYILLIFIILVASLYYMWKIGLKRYEAYG